MKRSPAQTRIFKIDTSFLYKKLSENTQDAGAAEIYKTMSAIEGTHASKILQKIHISDRTGDFPPPSRHAKIQVKLASVFGWQMIASSLLGTEKMIANNVITNKEKKGEKANPDIVNHFSILDNISKSSAGMKGASSQNSKGGINRFRECPSCSCVLGSNDGPLPILASSWELPVNYWYKRGHRCRDCRAMAGAFSMALANGFQYRVPAN